MRPIRTYIKALEAFIEHSGARLQRNALPERLHGRVDRNFIIVRLGLNPDQELIALVHEMAHWLIHRDRSPKLPCTLAEYEAEAVEALVMAKLGLPHPNAVRAIGVVCPTDNLLLASVTRVNWATSQICGALGAEAGSISEAQPSVDLEAAARKEVVFEYELYGMGDFLGLPEAL